jgi:hypothetical protein
MNIARHRELGALWLSLWVAACGGTVPGTQQNPGNSGTPDGTTPKTTLTAADHTPGYFRDQFRLLAAQAALSDETAVTRMITDFEARLRAPGDLPGLTPEARATLDGLWMLGLRATQATSNTPQAARTIGQTIFSMTLGLDPAVVAFNDDGGAAPVTLPGAGTLALAAQAAILAAADDAPGVCQDLNTTSSALYVAGPPERRWIAEYCTDEYYVEGYCEPDRWIHEDCYDEWVPEQCNGGRWIDQGYYEYYCYSADDCRYIWRERWVYQDGTCSGGYWEQYCYPGYWEPGICYDGYWVRGGCIPGHWEYIYPEAYWSYSAMTAAPQDCTTVRPQQYAIALAAMQVQKSQAYADIEPMWQAALDALLGSADINNPNEAVFDAAVQILQALVP